jgi:NTE family protein
MKTVSLVLGSGGARGLAHIGAIHWLEENDYKICSVAGSSIGAVIGGIYAAGKLEDFEQWVCAIRKVDILTLLDLSWGKSGLVKGDKIINTLVELVGEQLIEDLPIKYTAVATDVQGQKEIWIKSGSLFEAIRASMSLPLIFTPVSHRGSDLIDGGVLNPVPVAPVIGDGHDMIIAVNLGGPREGTEKQNIPPSSSASQSSLFHEKIRRFISRLQRSTRNSSSRDWAAYEIAIQSFETMQTAIARQKLASYPPDAVIEIARDACGTFEYDRASEMIELGHRKAKECLSQIAEQK